jgi:hypothetical protein
MPTQTSLAFARRPQRTERPSPARSRALSIGIYDRSYDEVNRKLISDVHWGRNLDAFNDILRGGFGTPEGGFILRSVNAARSRDLLGRVAVLGAFCGSRRVQGPIAVTCRPDRPVC